VVGGCHSSNSKIAYFMHNTSVSISLNEIYFAYHNRYVDHVGTSYLHRVIVIQQNTLWFVVFYHRMSSSDTG
jgi:hypothetical protein